MKNTAGFVLLGIGLIFAIYDFAVMLNYLFMFFIQIENQTRNEFLMGATIASVSAIPAWFSASLGVLLLKNKLHPIIKYTVYFCTALTFALLIYFLNFS